MQKVSLSNKVFTENPLLDEIVYNARQLATGTVLKDYDRANNEETVESIHNGDIYVAIIKGVAKFEYFTYTEDILRTYYVGEETIEKYAKDNSLIPEDDRPILLKKAQEAFLNEYEEYNNYYRMLHGLPDYDPTGAWEGLWIDKNKIDGINAVSLNDVSNHYIEEYLVDADGKYVRDASDNLIVISDYVPIHELSTVQLNILYDNGTIDNIVSNFEYFEVERNQVEYLLHTGDRSIPYYDARVGDRFSLLYCPPCDSEEVKKRFKDLIEANRLYLLYTIYSEAYKYRSDYYDNFMMVFIVIQTIIDMIIELPEYIIRRDIFDTRTCKYIFESNGVRYFSDIPLKYQVALVKNLNKIIKFKSTDKCIVDIASIFGIDNIQVFRYYIMKDRKITEDELSYINNTKEIIETDGTRRIEEDDTKNYDLRFIKVPLIGNYDDYIRNDTNVYDYDEIVDGDGYWIADKDYDIVKNDIKDLDFTVLRSKYYSIEAVIDLTKKNFTVVYFMNLLMYNKIDKDLLLVNVPNISTSKKFELIDIILALYSLSYIYYGVEDTILDSRSKVAQILGFNMEADLATIANYLYENHYGLTLEELKVNTFVIPEDGEIPSFKKLEDMYLTNKDIYDHVVQMLNDPPSKNVYDAYKYIFKSMFIMNRNMEYFMLGDNPFLNSLRASGYDKSKFINIPQPTDYTNPVDYDRDYRWLMESIDDTTVYFVMSNNFDESHLFDIYIKDGDTLENSGQTARMAETYREFLSTKDPVIFGYIQDIANIINNESRQEACINAIQSIVAYLKDYIDRDVVELDTVFSGLPSISLDFVKQYVTEVIDYFKSFKIFTHSSSILYLIDDKFGNYVQIVEYILLKYLLDKGDIVKIEDAIGGPIKKVGDILAHSGEGIRNTMSEKDRHEIIDKVWFDIDTWVLKHFKEYYDSDRYQEFTCRMKDIAERYSTYGISNEVEMVDIILNTLVDIAQSDKFEPKEHTSFEYSKTITEHYNEWLADMYKIMVNITVEDKLRMQDDMSRIDWYMIEDLAKMIDGIVKSSIIMDHKDRYTISDGYYKILTQEFPEHVFDE